MKRMLLVGLAIGGAVVGYRRVIRPWWWSWGIDALDVGRALSGDDLVPDVSTADTRSIEIQAPPSAVWPWLLQMGYGRAGWYSYDQIDMAGTSVRQIVPEWQGLSSGDVVPTHPGGGFEVRTLEPERALVLYSDSDLVNRQADAARIANVGRAAANVQATGAFLGAAQPADFAASWAFVLEPLTGGRTRLIERFRVRFGESDKPWTAFTLPLIGFGVFLMTRRQMLGIKERAESPSASIPSPRPDAADTAPVTADAEAVMALAT
jgi:hypothetical protein